jgi:adenine deaminase
MVLTLEARGLIARTSGQARSIHLLISRDELPDLVLVDAGFSPLEAITITTRNTALLMNASNEWGTIQPGRIANVLVINGRPDKNISDTRNIEMVIQAGKTIDREKLKFDALTDPGFRAIGSMSTTN